MPDIILIVLRSPRRFLRFLRERHLTYSGQLSKLDIELDSCLYKKVIHSCRVLGLTLSEYVAKSLQNFINHYESTLLSK